MWKHKTKWLVRGGRKVKCYLCGKKILAKGDLFLFHGDTGYYSHQSCMTESTTISGNERRRAVKKIAVGAAVVGAIAAGAGKFLDVSSQSKNSPAAQTILTSQGLIPPALTSDPANPVPGQMWYRSDAGVEAHFDGVQNRVVYSSEINDGNVHVTSKGIINGLSVLPNDGTGWFGPDTTEGATSRGQYGAPYTATSGIQEAINYIASNNGGKIILTSGTYDLSNAPLTTSNAISPGVVYNGSIITLPALGGVTAQLIIIEIEGETEAITFYNQSGSNATPPTPSGTIIYVSVSSASEYEAIVGTPADADGTSVWNTVFIVKNLTLRQPADNTTLTGINAGTIAGLVTENVNLDVNSETVNPNSNPVFGLVFPLVNLANGASFAIRTSIEGYAVGVEANEETTLIQSFIQYCNTGITVGNNYHAVVLDRVLIQGCQSYISSNSTGAAAIIGRSILIQTFGSGSWEIQHLIYDPDNDLSGTLEMNIVEAGTGDVLLSSLPSLGGYNLNIKQVNNTITPPTASITANPPVSGTAYQNTNRFDIRLRIPVTYSPTSTAAATLATGTSSTSTVTTSTKVSYPAGITTGIIDTYEMVVKAGQYFELVVTNATIGTVEVQAA